MTRKRILLKYLDLLALEGCRIRALEIGRMRDVTETVGHSTLHIASHPAVRELVSVDMSEATERVCRTHIPPDALAKITFINMPSTDWLARARREAVPLFDFAYIDGASDAQQCLVDVAGNLALLRSGGIMIQDDVDHRFDVKGDLTVPWLRGMPRAFHILEEVPADDTSQGQIVVRKA